MPDYLLSVVYPGSRPATMPTVGSSTTNWTTSARPIATGSRFVVVPPDGPDARLNLLADDVLHPVVTTLRDSTSVTELARASADVLMQLEPRS